MGRAACVTENCWRLQIFGYWTQTVDSTGTRNSITLTDRYAMRCQAKRNLSNIGAIILDGSKNIDIWECDTDDATKLLIDADADFLILSGDQMDASGNWVETIRPLSEGITSPEFNAVRNFMVSKGFDSAGADSCIGQNAGGRTRQQILDDFIVCLGGL